MNFKKTWLFANKICLGLIFFSLTGCAHMNSDFTCPMKPGQMCSSLDEVNTMVDQGKVGGRADSNDTITPYPMAVMTTGEPLRYGESVQPIWVAPYEDQAGNYYQSSLMYAVVQPSHWMENPVKAITHTD